MMNKIAMTDNELDIVSGGTVLPYIVQEGDSLQSIASKYHVTVEQIMKWNNLSASDYIRINQPLNLLGCSSPCSNSSRSASRE